MKIIIARPQEWIEQSKARTAKIWFHDVETLYDSIPKVCKSLNLEYEVRTNIKPGSLINIKNSIFLGHHTYGPQKNVWHIKKGYVPGYMYWDKKGYSGWSEALENYSTELNYGDEVQTEKLMNKYIIENSSKIKQPDKTKIPDHPYILVLGQRPHDTVAAHSYIDTINLSKLVNEAYKNTGIKVYTKPHPMSLNTRFIGKTIQGSIHSLISGARAIYTVNSGSGFEALFHKKQVFTSGACDYSKVSTVVKNLQDIKNTMHKGPNKRAIIHFLTYCFNEHFVNCYDKYSIERKILRCINEYEF